MSTSTKTTIVLPIRGMTCGHCVATVEAALKGVPGVHDAKVALQPGSAEIVLDDPLVDRAKLTNAIRDAGYDVDETFTKNPQVVTIAPLLPKPSARTLDPVDEDWDLAVTGMHCASCVGRVEEALRSVKGVRSARVNLATERASVVVNPSWVNDSMLVEAVKAAGYSAKRSILKIGEGAETLRREREEAIRPWRERAISGALLSIPLIVLSLAPLSKSFPVGWAMLPLATLLLYELGGPYFQGAWTRLKNGSTNMDTLIVMGTSTAYAYSLFSLIHDSPMKATYLTTILISTAYGAIAIFLNKAWTREDRRPL